MRLLLNAFHDILIVGLICAIRKTSLQWFTLFLILLGSTAAAQSLDNVKFMSYNLLNYPAAGLSYQNDTTTRHPHYRTIFEEVNPDILVVQEMNSQTGVNNILNSVLNVNTVTYSAAPFIDGYDTDNALFYKTSKFHAVTNTPIKTDLRDISEFKLVHTLSGDTIRIYSVHLKASSGSSNEAQRAREVDSLRKVTNALAPGTNFIVCGDFNIYASTESAYQKLLQIIPGNEGHFIDPITMTGIWNQNLASYRIHHTQSPRVRAFGGGSTGGLDDRFDLVLYSNAVSTTGGMTYVPNSEIAYGNDGNLYNDSINKPTNTAVTPTIANALHNASDHIPVIAQFSIEYNGSSIPTDFGAEALLSPLNPMCSNANQSMIAEVKNYGALAVDLSTNSLQVIMEVTDPSLSVQTFAQIVNTGTINAGDSLPVTFSTSIDMTVAGNYTFRFYTVQANDANQNNDTLSPVTINVTSSPTATISPAGPVNICPGDFVTLTASSGVAYLWSGGQTSQSVLAADTGNYSVEVTIAGGCSSSSAPVYIGYNTTSSSGVVFYESMGSVGATTTIANHELNDGFDNDFYTMSGTADIRNTSPSAGYTGASGLANVFFTAPGREFIISGINTLGVSNLVLSHGIYKNQNASNATEIIVEVSSNGVDYSPLTVPPVASGTGTSTWHYRVLSGAIPSVPNLSIRFTYTSGTAQFRIDDITLSGNTSSPTITASGPTTFCQGDSVILSASAGNQYLWSNGATTQSITVTSAGSYSVRVDCNQSPLTNVAVNNCQNITIHLKAFIQGYYIGNQSMIAVADPVGHPSVCDTLILELHNSLNPYNSLYSGSSTIDTSGFGDFMFPAAVYNNEYYLVVRHRNAIETWSAAPVLLNDSIINYDFTTSAGSAFGNNLANMDGEFCLFSGDVSSLSNPGTQDGIIDTTDLISIENDLLLFATGYDPNDLTGDRLVESSDYSLVETNMSLGILVMKP